MVVIITRTGYYSNYISAGQKALGKQNILGYIISSLPYKLNGNHAPYLLSIFMYHDTLFTGV